MIISSDTMLSRNGRICSISGRPTASGFRSRPFSGTTSSATSARKSTKVMLAARRPRRSTGVTSPRETSIGSMASVGFHLPSRGSTIKELTRVPTTVTSPTDAIMK